MAVRIRMKRLGRRNRPFWRICATDKRAARDGRVIEELGHYDPHLPDADKATIKRDRVVHWLRQGATPSKTVAELLGHLGLDAKGNEIPPKPWPKKRRGPPPKAAERLAAEKAEAAAETPETERAEAQEPQTAEPQAPAAAKPQAEQAPEASAGEAGEPADDQAGADQPDASA